MDADGSMVVAIQGVMQLSPKLDRGTNTKTVSVLSDHINTRISVHKEDFQFPLILSWGFRKLSAETVGGIYPEVMEGDNTR